MTTATREQAGKVFHVAEARLVAARGQLSSAWTRMADWSAPLREPSPAASCYVPGDPEVRRRLWRCALLGFAGSAAILLGASQASSPFTTKSMVPPAWFFGLRQAPVLVNQTPQPGIAFFLSLAAFYGGLVLVIRAWIRLHRLTRERPGIPIRYLAAVAGAWTVPILFVAPLLSNDAYSYVAQGEMMSHHISPYRFGPAVLGLGGNSYTDLTARLWWYATSPYGPLFLGLSGLIQTVVGSSELAALVMFRVLALVGVGLVAVSVPRLARSFGRDAGAAFVFAVMNPLVLIHLIGGEHNDALMLGFLVAGLALARERHPVLGIVFVALATLVKVPALIGVVYIGWDWAGERASFGRRVGQTALAGLIAAAVMAALTEAVGLGWGWVRGLGNPDSVRSYLDPATAVGLGAARLLEAVGGGDHSHLFLTLARGSGAALAAGIGIVLLLRSTPGASRLRAVGLTMLAVVVFGPVMQPWYLAWGVILLGPVVSGRSRVALTWLIVIETFLGIGDATPAKPNPSSYLAGEFEKANPVVFAVTAAIVVGLLFGPDLVRLYRRVRASTADADGLVREEVTAGL